MFEITGFVCVLNYEGKRGEIGFVRDSGVRDSGSLLYLYLLYILILRNYVIQVCYNCRDHEAQSPGVTRDLSDFFQHQRNSKRINVLTELDRLVEGFKLNVKASRINSVMTETFSNIKVPLWQRSYKWLVRDNLLFLYFRAFHRGVLVPLLKHHSSLLPSKSSKTERH